LASVVSEPHCADVGNKGVVRSVNRAIPLQGIIQPAVRIDLSLVVLRSNLGGVSVVSERRWTIDGHKGIVSLVNEPHCQFSSNPFVPPHEPYPINTQNHPQ
jgi:hypothetical protein